MLERDAVGALVISGSDVTAIVASGGGVLTKNVVVDVGQRVATSLGGTVTVDDVAPLPPSDPGGSALFFFIACCVGAFLTVTMVAQAVGKPRTLVVTSIGAAIVAPLLSFGMTSIFVDFGVPFGSATAVIGIGMLVALTSGLIASVFTRLLGNASIFGIIVVLVALNFPSAGGSIPASMQPEFWQVIHSIWFGSGGYESMRSILFFDGNQSGRWLIQLLIWLGAAAAVLATIVLVQKRRAIPAAAALAAEPGEDGEDATPREAEELEGHRGDRKEHVSAEG